MSGSTPRIAIFDLDGTLLDSRAAIIEAVAAGIEEVARANGHPELRADREAIVEAMGVPADEYFRRVLPATLHSLAGRVKEAATTLEVQALREGRGRLFPGTVESLDRLRAAGTRLAVVSNAQPAYFHAALDELDLRPRLLHVECYEELPAGTEPPYKAVLVARALRALSAVDGVHWMVGDRAEDLHAGRAHGCRSAGLRHGFGDETELAVADHVADDLPSLVDFLLGS